MRKVIAALLLVIMLLLSTCNFQEGMQSMDPPYALEHERQALRRADDDEAEEDNENVEIDDSTHQVDETMSKAIMNTKHVVGFPDGDEKWKHISFGM